MTRTVCSPAGEEIAVYTDKEWMELTGVPLQSLQWSPSRRAVLGCLWNHGKYEDRKSGKATRLLIDDASKEGYGGQSPSALNALFKSDAMIGAVERDINGKRTYRVQLTAVCETWLSKLQANGYKMNVDAHKTTLAEPVVEEVEQVEEVEDEAPAEVLDVYQPEPDVLELQVSHAVARSLLTQVVEIINAGVEITRDDRVNELERDLSMAHQRLASRLEENDKLRRKVRQLEDELAAAHTERDGLRGRLRAAEYNLEKAMSSDNQRIIMAEVHREMDKIMRAKPASDKAS
jgi:hypothetical protein